jgi:hypothetical protein
MEPERFGRVGQRPVAADQLVEHDAIGDTHELQAGAIS